jgi:hypothetical protein
MFKKYTGDWKDLRIMLTPALVEIDYHADSNEPDGLDFWQRVDETFKGALGFSSTAADNRRLILFDGANHRFEFYKRRHFFIRVHNKTLAVVAVRVSNPDCSSLRING